MSVLASTATLDPLALLAAVRTIAEVSGDPAPERLSTRRWDAARPLSGRFGGAPAARRISERLGIPWPKVRELAFLPPRAQLTALGRALSELEGDWLTFEYAEFVLALIARRLGVTTLTPSEYRGERARMLANHRHGNLRLPTESQVVALAGNWDRALSHAGLRRRPHGRGGHRARSTAVSIIDVLDRCYEHHGTEPTTNELAAFAKANGIPVPRKDAGRPFSDYAREWKEHRTEQGLPVPSGPPPKAQRPDYTVDVGAGRPGERRAKDTWDDLDELVDWATRYLRQLAGQRSSKRGYDDWARDQEGAPWSKTFDKFGGWAAVRDAAWERLRGGSPRLKSQGRTAQPAPAHASLRRT